MPFPSITVCNSNRIHCGNLRKMVLDCRNSTACEREDLYCRIFVKTKCYEIFPNNSVCIYDDYYPNKTEGPINNKHKLINDLTTTELKRALHGPETLIARCKMGWSKLGTILCKHFKSKGGTLIFRDK